MQQVQVSGGAMTGTEAALPWLVVAIVLVAFSLSDDLPAPGVRRVFVAVGAALLVVAAFGRWRAPGIAPPTHLLVAAGPLLFLLIHHLLRRGFRKIKKDEPTLVFGSGIGGTTPGGFFFEPGVARRVTRLDYLYSFLLGLGMLLAVAAAAGELIGAGR